MEGNDSVHSKPGFATVSGALRSTTFIKSARLDKFDLGRRVSAGYLFVTPPLLNVTHGWLFMWGFLTLNRREMKHDTGPLLEKNVRKCNIVLISTSATSQEYGKIASCLNHFLKDSHLNFSVL